MELLFILHVGATLALVGLIWVVQLAVYPLYGHVAAGPFGRYHEAWCARITWVVAPLFAFEGLGAAALVFGGAPPALAVDPKLALLGFATFVANALSTAFVQVPLHARLSRSFDPATHARLVRTNWLRTVLWTVHGGVVLAMCLTLAT